MLNIIACTESDLNSYLNENPLYKGSQFSRSSRPLKILNSKQINQLESSVLNKTLLHYLLKDDDGMIHGCFQLHISEILILEMTKRAAFLSSLRLSSDFQAQESFANQLEPFLKNIKETHNIHHIFCCLTSAQRKALTDFIHPRSLNTKRVGFHLLSKQSLVLIHGAWKNNSLKLPHVSIKKISKKSTDEELLKVWDYRSKTHSPFGNYLIQNQWDQKSFLKSFKKNSLKALIATDSNNNTVGTLLYKSSKRTALKFKKATSQTKSFSHMLTFIKLAAHTKRFKTKTDSTFIFDKILSYQADNPDVFNHMLFKAFKSSKGTQALGYYYGDKQWEHLPSRNFLHSKRKLELYEILEANQPLPKHFNFDAQSKSIELPEQALNF